MYTAENRATELASRLLARDFATSEQSADESEDADESVESDEDVGDLMSLHDADVVRMRAKVCAVCPCPCPCVI